jgi:hypothetical protein
MFCRLELYAKQVGAGLHQKYAGRQTAIATKTGYVNCGFDAEQVEYIAHLVGDRLNGGTSHVPAIAVGTETNDGRACFLTPMRSTKPGECWNDEHALVVLDFQRQAFSFFVVRNDAELVSQPA